MYALLFAFLSPVLYAAMNVTDKTVIVHKVKHTYGYATVVGLVNLIFAIAVALFQDWSAVAPSDLIFPIAAGVILGIQTFIYLKILEEEDISNLIGFLYLYPIIVMLLSYMFLNEVIPPLGYIGAMMGIAGVLLLSVRKARSRTIIVVSIGALTLLVAVGEFFVKVATDSLTAWQGVSINQAAMGITLMLALFHPAINAGFRNELRNMKWAALSEVLTFSAVLTLYLAMEGLPATAVSSIAAIQPLFVLIFERAVDTHVGKISRDHLLLPKLGAILLIVAGVVLLSLAI